jgi:hypothetical protein
MNLSKPLALIYLLAVSLIILCPSPRAQEAAPSGANNKKPPAGEGRGQKKPDKCEMPSPVERNWELMGRDYVYFDYVLCPPGLEPPTPLVRVWLTTKGDGFGIEKWTDGRDGADLVSVYRGKKRAFILYRDLDAVPLSLFKAERRSTVAAEMARQPFLLEGPNLIPLENLTPESVERVKNVFGSADVLIKQAQRKSALLNESPRIGIVVDALAQPLKAQ